MGGKLLKKWGLPEKRLSSTEYENLENEVTVKLIEDFHQWGESMVYGDYIFKKKICIETAPAIRSKADHGDLDITIGVDFLLYKDFIAYIENQYKVKPHQNSNVVSFPVNGFQVDVMFVYNDIFDQTIAYTSWGDLGNLMGRIYHKMGLHYGHEGLQYWIREGMFRENTSWSNSDHICAKFVITRKMKEICSIGGFDYVRWLQGFNTEEEAFQFIASSKYFQKEFFSIENLNHINRVRNRKRGMYMRFLEWIENTNPPDSPTSLLSKEDYLLYFQYNNMELRNAIDKHRFNYTIKTRVKEKFSGKTVIETVGDIGGEKIGVMCGMFKSMYGSDEIIKMPQEQINHVIKVLYNKHYGSN